MAPRFLRYWLNAIDWMPHVGGTTRAKLTQAGMAQVSIPLPPAAEQRRIVAKLDSLAGHTARAQEQLGRIPNLIQRYRDAILAAAFSGELTKQWRLDNGVSQKWTELKIGNIARIASGQTPKGIEQSLNSNGDVSWFKVSSMNEPENLQGLRSSQFRLSRATARKLGLRIFPVGSIAFPKRGGAIATNKKRRLLVEGALDLNVMVLTATGVTGDFLWWWLQKLDLSQISNGSNVPQINNGDIEPLQINVPSRREQDEIARRLQASFAWLDRVVVEHANASRLLTRLDQAILAKAFRGEMVPQDPNDEPVEICATTAATEGPARRGRSRRASN